MKKAFSALLVLTMILSILPALSVQTAAKTDGIWQYSVSEGEVSYGGATITGFDKSFSGAVVIPSQLGGYPVTAIGRYAFKGCTGLTSVTIPEGVTKISNYAFCGCTGLTSVTIPSSVTEIGWGAFRDCTGLTSIAIPSSVTGIGERVFSGCTSLTSITIPRSVTSIGDDAFSGCTGLKSITIPERVNYISNYAFSGCSGLTNITILGSVTSIGGDAFSGCTGLTSITIPKSVTTIGASAFSGCIGLTSITIPEGVREIGYYAFEGCSGLTNITADKKNPVYRSDGNCLIEKATGTLVLGCKTSVIPTDGSVTKIDFCAFLGCTGLTNITIPEGVREIGSYAFDGCTGLTSINIPESVIRIKGGAFYGCTGLTNITADANNTIYKSEGNCLIEKATGTLVLGCKTSVIPTDGSVTKIDFDAFLGCTGLTNINIPKSVTAIEGCAFEGCTGLTSVTIPEGVTKISNYAFCGCTGLTSVTIPSSVTEIGWGAFLDCTGLTSITVDKNNTVYKSADNCLIEKSTNTLIKGCNTSVIPSDGSVTLIGEGAFDGCTGLSSINIPSGVTSIGRSAFSGCTGLTSINIPSGVTFINGSAFSGCTGLTSITVDKNNPEYKSEGNCLIEKLTGNLVLGCKTSVIPTDGSVTSIGTSAFSRCTGLTSITIPSSVTTIGIWAFGNCTGLTSIKLPASVTTIGDSAFSGCTGLSGINILSNMTSIGSFAFEDCDNLIIYGRAGSYAQKYADKKGIPFVEYRELTDTSSGVTVGGGVPENAELSVVVKEQTSEKAVFDISLVKGGETVQPNGTVRVALPVSQGMNGADMRVYHIADNGAKTDMNAVYSNGFMIFDTDHFSVYSIEPTLDIVCGDANGDGTVDISDAMLVLYHVAGKNLLPGSVLARCDTDDSGTVDIVDAMKILYYVANKTDSVK